MKREAFFQNVKKGAFERVYFFYGPEEYVKASALKALREAILPEGLEMVNEAVLVNPSLEDLDAAAQTMPFMAERRLVVVNDLAALRQSKGRRGRGSRHRRWQSSAGMVRARAGYRLRGDLPYGKTG